MNRWSSKVEALHRLIAPGSGATDAERDTAKGKLEQILKNHYGQAEGHYQFANFAERYRHDPSSFDAAFAATFTTRDYVRAKQSGVNMSGEWTGRNMQEAMQRMCEDLVRRAFVGQPRFIVNEPKEWGKG